MSSMTKWWSEQSENAKFAMLTGGAIALALTGGAIAVAIAEGGAVVITTGATLVVALGPAAQQLVSRLG